MNPNTVALMFALPLLLIPVLYVLDAWQRSSAVESWLSVSAINGAVESSADVLDPFGLNSLATSLMADLDPTSSTGVSLTKVTPSSDDNDHDPFDARDLPNVLDRVVTPVLIEVPGVFYGKVSKAWVESWGVHVLMAEGNTVSLDYGLMVELVGPVTVLDAPDGVIAYVADGELLCADHGAPFDIGVSDGAVSPVFRDNGAGLDAVEYCGHHFGPGDYGHSFCGSCGSYMEPKGHPDTDLAGPFFRCSNCSTSAVYVDGLGYQFVHDLSDVLDGHRADVTGVTVTYRTNLDGTTKVDEVDTENMPWSMVNLRAYVAWIEAFPHSVLLILCESEDEAWETVDAWAESQLDCSDAVDEDEAEGMLSDWRANTRIVRVDLDAVTFTTKGSGR